MNKQPQTMKESSFLFSTSLIFDENIDKLWLFLKDLSIETKLTHFLDNFKFIKGDNTWTIGNIFSIYWVGVSNIEIKCLSSFVTRMKKKIKWKFKCEIGISYYKSVVLYRITNDNKTLVKVTLSKCENNKLIDINPQMSYYVSLQSDILNFQSKYLQSIKKDKVIYQSCIIDKNHSKLWNFLIDLKHIDIFCPGIIKNVEYKGAYNEIGTFIKFYICHLNKICFYRISKFVTPIKTKTYTCLFAAVGTDIGNSPSFIEVQMTIIDEKKTFFSVLFNFENKPNMDFIDTFDNNLKNIINKMKQYIKENEKDFNID